MADDDDGPAAPDVEIDAVQLPCALMGVEDLGHAAYLQRGSPQGLGLSRSPLHLVQAGVSASDLLIR